MEKLAKRKCKVCKKTFHVRLAETRRRDPKYCSSPCYGKTRRISSKEKARRKAAYSRQYYANKKKLILVNQAA